MDSPVGEQTWQVRFYQVLGPRGRENGLLFYLTAGLNAGYRAPSFRMAIRASLSSHGYALPPSHVTDPTLAYYGPRQG